MLLPASVVYVVLTVGTPQPSFQAFPSFGAFPDDETPQGRFIPPPVPELPAIPIDPPAKPKTGPRRDLVPKGYQPAPTGYYWHQHAGGVWGLVQHGAIPPTSLPSAPAFAPLPARTLTTPMIAPVVAPVVAPVQSPPSVPYCSPSDS